MKRSRDEEDPDGGQLSQEEMALVLDAVNREVIRYYSRLQDITRTIGSGSGIPPNRASIIEAFRSAPGFEFVVPSTPPSRENYTEPFQEYHTDPGEEYVAQTPPAGDFDIVMEQPTVTEKPRQSEREEKFVEGEMEEASSEVQEVEEVKLDEETGLYIGQKAEEIYNEVLEALLDHVIEGARQTSPGIADYPPRLLRLQILDDPAIKGQLDNARDETLDALKVEIWRLLQQEDTAEER